MLMEALQQPWQVQEKAIETDISALQWVEDLEQRVVTADLHMKVRNASITCVYLTCMTCTRPDDLYCGHVPKCKM